MLLFTDGEHLYVLCRYLQTYENTVVVVSHARDFLNEIVTDILELDNKKIKRYKGDYDTFEKTKADELHRNERAKESSDKKRDAVAKFVAKNIGGGSKAASMAKSRQKMLDKMNVYDAVRRARYTRTEAPCHPVLTVGILGCS